MPFDLSVMDGIILLIAGVALVIISILIYQRTIPLPPQSVRRYLIWLRASAFVLVLIFIIEPIFAEDIRDTINRRRVVIVDRSASMDAHTVRLDSLMAQIDDAEIIQIHRAPDNQRTDLYRALSDVSQRSDLLDVTLISDGNHTNGPVRDIGADLTLYAIPVGTAPQRAEIRSIDIRLPKLDPFFHQRTDIPVRLRTYSIMDGILTLRLSINGQLIQQQNVTLTSDDELIRIPASIGNRIGDQFRIQVTVLRGKQRLASAVHTVQIRAPKFKILYVFAAPDLNAKYAWLAMDRSRFRTIYIPASNPELISSPGDSISLIWLSDPARYDQRLNARITALQRQRNLPMIVSGDINGQIPGVDDITFSLGRVRRAPVRMAQGIPTVTQPLLRPDKIRFARIPEIQSRSLSLTRSGQPIRPSEWVQDALSVIRRAGSSDIAVIHSPDFWRLKLSQIPVIENRYFFDTILKALFDDLLRSSTRGIQIQIANPPMFTNQSATLKFKLLDRFDRVIPYEQLLIETSVEDSLIASQSLPFSESGQQILDVLVPSASSFTVRARALRNGIPFLRGQRTFKPTEQSIERIRTTLTRAFFESIEARVIDISDWHRLRPALSEQSADRIRQRKSSILSYPLGLILVILIFSTEWLLRKLHHLV